MLLRIGMTLLILLLTGVAIYFFRYNGLMALISLVFGLVLIATVWLVSRMGNVQELQNQNSPQAIDRNTKKLIGIINESFNDKGIEEIGEKTQKIVGKILEGLRTDVFKSEKHAVASLKRVPPSKFHEAKDTTFLAATLAAYYVLADELNEYGFNTRTRVDNFIAGIQDDSF